MANYVSNVTIPTDGGSTASYNIRELFPHVGNCTDAAATAAKTVTIGNFKLYTGAWVVVKFSNTNSAAVASLTLNVDGTGAKPIKYRNANLSSAGLLIANRYTYFIYDGTNYQIVGDFDTNSDTYDRNRYRANIKAGTSALVAGNIIVGKDGVFSHLKSGGSFDISYPILYLNEAVAAEGTTKNSYDIINFTITTTQSISLTAYLPVFIKGTLSGKMFTPVSTAPLTQTVPTTDDGYQYMYLGNATSTSAVYLTERHPIYAYKNNAFGEIVHTASNVNGYTVGKSVPSDAVFTDTEVTQTADNSSNSDNYELLISNSANNTTETAGARKSSRLRFNPSNGRVIMQGPLIVRATDGVGSYDEGIRINAGKNGYSTLTFGGGQDTISGTADGQFWVGTNSTNDSYKRKLYIAHAGSTGSGTYFYVSSASQVSPALKLGTSGSIANGNGDAVTGGVVYTALSNYLGAKSDGSYYGMANPAGADNVWIRTTSQGIIPYQSGGAGSGHNYLGTSSWYFAHAYIDTVHGTLDGTASAWTTARTLTLDGQLTGSVSVKGDANMTLKGYLDRAFIYDDNAVPSGHTWAEYAWHKFAEVTIATTYTDCVITFLVSRTYSSSAENAGILSAKLRTKGDKVYDSAQLKWLVRNSGLSKDDFVMVYTSTSGTSTKAELWCRLPDQYSGLIFTVLKEHKRQYSTDTSWTLVKTPDGAGSTHGSSSYPTTGITGTIISSDGTITNSTTGTAATATTAANANVTVTDVPSTSTATDPWYQSYGLLFAQNPNITQSNTLRKSHNLRFYHSTNGTADTVGIGELIVGNNTASGTAGNMQGKLILYSSSSSYISMVPTATSSPVILTLPAVTGTVPSFTTTPTSGQVVVADGTAGGVKSSGYTIAKSVPSNAVFTDRYVNTASFADDSTNTAASPVKMTLTRAGSDTANVTANIPKVSSTSAGVAPKGATVSSQSQSTKFLREDGSWAAPSYTSIPSNNVTGSGTSGYLTKWNGTNTITNGPKLGSSTTTYLRNDGEWATPPDTKNTAGSTDTSSKIFLIGATSQAANPQTYSDDQCYVKSGALQVNLLYSTTTICANTANSNTAGGISLYSSDPETYGIMFRGTTNSGKHGYVQSDWATYFTMNSGATTRGWIFRRKGDGNYASISGAGNAVFNGSVTVGGNSTNTSGCRMEYNSTTQTLDFVFV